MYGSSLNGRPAPNVCSFLPSLAAAGVASIATAAGVASSPSACLAFFDSGSPSGRDGDEARSRFSAPLPLAG